jgi:GNAT superfamily N-acetyltransferase
MPEQADDIGFPVTKSSGITESERYLAALCQKNFLSFWSYPRPFRNQGGNKELCDLLVVMGDDAIVFSDKHCALEPRATLEVDWQRWFRSAVESGARQGWGALRWLREHPERVFLDPECRHSLPIQLPSPDTARYHLVVTVHGVAAACRTMLGGTGSLMMRTDIRGLAAHKEPFVIGDLDPDRPFVHVFDDSTLDFVMSTLDTTTDFLRYLREKERLFRSRTLYVAGEENLLAHYLSRVDGTGEHAFRFDPHADVIAIDESWWPHFASSKERRAQVQHDQVSYVWDRLIERFAKHALGRTQYNATEPSLSSSETVLRFMAAEPRLRRRALAEALVDAMENTAPDQRRIRVVPRQFREEPMYVFLLFPWRDDRSEDANRNVRRNYLEMSIFVAKMKYPAALDIIGVATESGVDHVQRSEDAVYFDARGWSAVDEEHARTYQRDFEILVAPRRVAKSVVEYPASGPATSDLTVPKNPRNKPCPCGSGLKYKFCHGS